MLDAIAATAARVCEAPIASISLVEDVRQWSKAVVGDLPKELVIDVSFCVHAMHPPTMLVVPDATLDERFAQNPLVSCDDGIRSYAGAPLLSPAGEAIGTLSVLDRMPRMFTASQLESLRVLADGVMAHLNLRKQQLETARAEGAMLDMLTEYRRSEYAIRASEQRYRMLFAQNPAPMWVYDLESLRFLAVNKAAVQHYGYSEAEFLGMTLADIRERADLPVLERALASISAGEQQVTSTRHRLRNGTIIDVEVTGDAITFDQRPARLALVHDVTAQVAAERLRRESEERYALAVQGSSAGLWDWDVRTGAAFLSARYQELVGYQEGDLEGRFTTFVNLLHPDDRARTLQAVEAHLSPDREPFDIDYRLRSRGGEYRWFNARGQALWDEHGVAYRMAGSIADITDRQRAVDALRESEERFRLLSRATNDAIWDWDLVTGLIWWNEGYSTQFGYPVPSAPLDATASWKDRILPEDREPVLARIEHVIASGENSWADEYRFLRIDGTYAWVFDRGNVIRNGDGRAVRMVGGMTDVTERRRAQATQLRAQRMESIGTLAGGIAHDLNNLLSPMMMSIELLRGVCNDEASAELLQTVQTSAARGAALVQQVLSFARGVEGQHVPVSPLLLVRELQHIIRDSFPKSIRVSATHGDDAWSVAGDPTQLHQVLLNLCVNARDAMPGGGELRITVENVEVDETLAALHGDAQPGDYVVIRVADTGTGIAPEVRERMFEPFFSTKDVGKGTGLGLSTTLAIIRSHGGFISVYSEVGTGTTFRVHLPASRTQRVVAAPSGAAPVITGGTGELILVVDDEEAIRRVAQRTLERFGYTVITAANGVEALEVYEQRGREIAVVFTDMAMPEMDGPELIAELRAINPSVRIIGSSGLTSSEGLDREVGSPVMHFVSKPYTADAMLKVMRQVLDAR